MDMKLPEDPGATVAAAPPQARRHRAMGIALVTLLLVLAACTLLPPLLVRHERMPNPIRLTSMQGQVSGTYVTASGALYKLVPFADRLSSPPPGLTVTGRTPPILIRAQQLDVPQAYQLQSWNGGRTIPVARSLRDAHTRALRVLAPLRPGCYCIQASEDGVEVANDYFYFRVGSGGP